MKRQREIGFAEELKATGGLGFAIRIVDGRQVTDVATGQCDRCVARAGFVFDLRVRIASSAGGFGR